MNTKKMLLAVGMLILLAGLNNRAASEAAFAVIPDKEAVQIVGGSGRACNVQVQIEGWYWCDGTWMDNPPLPEEDCWGGQFTYLYEYWVCGDAPSGQCEDNIEMWIVVWCPCEWFPEYQNCSPNNDWDGYWGYACQ
jgi:hypothetical protein